MKKRVSSGEGRSGRRKGEKRMEEWRDETVGVSMR